MPVYVERPVRVCCLHIAASCSALYIWAVVPSGWQGDKLLLLVPIHGTLCCDLTSLLCTAGACTYPCGQASACACVCGPACE